MASKSSLQQKKILLIDDDMELFRLINKAFQLEGVQVISASDGKDGLQQLQTKDPDLVLLDIMMPEMDGWATIQNIRQQSEVPVIMLSALGQDQHVIRGLRGGADDYVSKPFSFQVLVARVKAHLRRAAENNSQTESPDFDDGYLYVDLDGRRVMVKGDPVSLTPTEFELLAYLVRNTGRTRSFSQILEHVWGERYRYNAEYVHVYMSRLRQKLEDDPKRPVYFHREHGIGYRFS